VLTRFPDVQFRLEQGQRQGQTVAADGLGQRDDVRPDAGLLEGEERTGTPAAHLDVVDDEQQVVPLAQGGQGAQPLVTGETD